MRYIQGTVITIEITVTNSNTGLPADPPDVQLAVQHPDKTVTTSVYNNGLGVLTRVSTGVYQGTIDTSPAYGQYTYETAALGPNAVRSQRVLIVEPKIGP